MKTANRRILIGFILLIAVFSISEIVSFRNLEKSKEISSRNAVIFQPSIIYLSELELTLFNAEKYTESWVFFDIVDHPDKNKLRELHKTGVNKLTANLAGISSMWENSEDEKRLVNVFNSLDSIFLEQQLIMSKLNSLEAYSNENWLALIEVEDQHLVRVKEFCALAKEDITVLISHMKKRSLNEKNIAQSSFESIKTVHAILAVLVVIISIIVAWSMLRFLRSEQQKKVITEERDEIQVQKIIIEEKNKEILDSINYAKRIQNAMLPSFEEIKRNFPSNFIFYQPRDIVSGDFYWLREITVEGRRLTIMAAADATGHGVPGAFVSFVCYSSLNRAVDEFKLTSPNHILDKVSEIVSETFTSTDNNEVYDGMDISLCVFDFEAKTLQFSGANNSAYVYRGGEMHKLVATRKSVGRGDSELLFSVQNWNLEKDDLIYLFTDGFQDQFGGEKGKKYRAGRFHDLLKKIGGSNENILESLKVEFNDWKGAEEQIDDVLIIGVKIGN